MRRRDFLGAPALAALNTAAAAELRFPIAFVQAGRPPRESGVLTLERFYLAVSEAGAVTQLLDALERDLRQAGRLVTRQADAGPAGLTLIIQEPPCAGEPRESCVRVPLWLRLPGGRRSGEREDSLFGAGDLLPTLLNDARPPHRNLWQRISTGQGERAESVYCRGPAGEWRVMVRGFDKLVVDRNLQAAGLFNLAQDPAESSNLLQEPAQRRLRDELTAHLREWMRRAGDGFDPNSGLKIRRGK